MPGPQHDGESGDRREQNVLGFNLLDDSENHAATGNQEREQEPEPLVEAVLCRPHWTLLDTRRPRGVLRRGTVGRRHR